MSARLGFWIHLCFAMALGACSRPAAIHAEPDAGNEWVLEVPADGGRPEPGPWTAHAKSGVVVIHAAPEQSWGAVIGAMDLLKQVGGRSMVLSAGASRRTKSIAFPSTREGMIPAFGEVPTVSLVSVELGGDGTPNLGDAHGVSEVRRTLVRDVHDGGLPTIVLLRADEDAPFARVLDVVDVAQELGLRVAFTVSPRRPH